MAEAFAGFTRKLHGFLRDLEKRNDRDWFTAHQADFEAHVREPLRAFIRAMGEELRRLSPHFVADDRKVGGSMMRIQRDVRFSKDKSPYNTWVAARFLHEKGKKAPAPGFYLHLSAKETTLGTGIWHPEPPALARIRKAILADGRGWVRARDDRAFRAVFPALGGESLKRPPAGVAADHPLVEDLKRKDYCAFATWKPADAIAADFLDRTAAAYRASAPLIRFLCGALGLKY